MITPPLYLCMGLFSIFLFSALPGAAKGRQIAAASIDAVGPRHDISGTVGSPVRSQI
jgi:hypothetical protein